MKRLINSLLLTISISFTSVTAYEPTDSLAFHKYYLNPAASSQLYINDIFIPPSPPYPNFGAVLQNSKISTSINSQMLIGEFVPDPFTGRYGGGFEFPNLSGADYLYIGALWFGGIIGEDTLVSVGMSKELLYDTVQSLTYINVVEELHAPDALTENKSTSFISRDSASLYHTIAIDTFTTGIFNLNPWQMIFERHRPMNIEVILKGYVRKEPPFKNIVLLDFVITNKNHLEIQDSYVGIYIDADINSNCVTDRVRYDYSDNIDDLAGSFKEIGTAYFIDKDGNLTDPECLNKNPTGALAIKPITTYPPATDTNFNWWAESNTNFGPRKRGTDSDPFREFGVNLYGTPTFDSNKYYILSHPEWDYDQCMTNLIPFSDTTWMLPDTSIAADVADGEETKGLISLGPFDILPDSSIRAIFALFAGEMVHLDPTNWKNLQDSNYTAYYDNLYFDVLKDNAMYAEILADQYLDSQTPPTGLKVEYHSKDSVQLNWDRFVFPDVTGYNIYIKEIPDSLLLARKFIRPDIKFEDIPTEQLYFNLQNNTLVLTDLSPSSIYSCRISQNNSGQESELSETIIFGHDNPFTTPEMVFPSLQFTPIHPEHNKVILKWDYPLTDDILYYKIYRSRDSLAAIQRYQPFIYNHPERIPFQYQAGFETPTDSQYFYEWHAFDSTDGRIHQYIDSLTDDGYYYWITAVNNYRFESSFSPLIKAVKTPNLTKDIVVLLGSTDDEQDYAIEDSIIHFYFDLLDGYNYDIYNWTDSNIISVNCSTGYCTTWEDLSKYKLIIVEEYPASKILTTPKESSHKLFTRLSDIGHNIAYFGIPPGTNSIGLSTFTDEIIYNPYTFEQEYMGLSKTFLKPWFGNYDQFGAIDSLGGFTQAIPTKETLPTLNATHYNQIVKPFFRQLFDISDNLPYTAAFETTPGTEVLYRFQSLYPQSSHLQDLPVGVVKENPNGSVFTFGFHLWGIEPAEAGQLVEYLFSKRSKHSSPYTIPDKVSLEQNYPNPFNGTTQISLSLNQTLPVSLEIFNILGQRIKTLIDTDYLPPGNHTFVWDGTNEQQTDVSSGIYFYRILIEEKSLSRKMLLIK